MSRVLCKLTDIPDGEGHGFERDGDEDDIIVVRQGDRTLAIYKGRPRHVNVNDIQDEDELEGR